MRLGVRVIAQLQEVVPFGGRDEHRDVREWLQQAIDDLLVITCIGKGSRHANGKVARIEPSILPLEASNR